MEEKHLSIGNLIRGNQSAKSMLSSIFVVSTFFLLGLVFKNKYEDLFMVKYIYYYTTALIFIVSILVISIFNRIKNKNKILIPFSKTQYILIVFFIVCTISTVYSDYTFEAFWGNEGRYNGLFLMSLYCLSTFFISKYLFMKKWYLNVFLFSGFLINLIGIGDYFKLNILHFKDLSDRGADIFTSTIGNINFYTAYVALTLGCATGLFIIEKNLKNRIAYYICFVIAFSAIVMGSSDNAYLSIITIFAALPFFTLKSYKTLIRNLILVASSITIFKIIAIVNTVFKNKVVAVDGLLSLAGDQRWLWWMVFFLWATVLLLTIHNNAKKNIYMKIIPYYYRYIWFLLLLLTMLFIVFILWDVNINHSFERYGSLKNYLFFDDNWGTSRGFAWRIAWGNFQSFPMRFKIFGYGLDTFGILTIFNNKREMLIGQGSFYDSIHNEYLQYLVTIGVAGLASYIVFLIVAVRSMVKNLSKEPYLLGIILAVLAYAIQAVVNINQVPVASLMWCLIATGMAACRNDK